MKKQKKLSQKEKGQRKKENATGMFIGLMTILFVLAWGFDIRMPQREGERNDWLAENQTQAVEAHEATLVSDSDPWWYAWNDIQGSAIPSEYLWSISTHWDALNSSDCNPLWMASVWHNETGNDVTSNNPFELSNPSPNATMEGFAEDVRTACAHLQSKISEPLPREINRENIGLYAEASFGYNGRASARTAPDGSIVYGSWDRSAYVVNRLDSSRNNMYHCAEDGCPYLVVKARDGVMTFFLKLLKQGE